MSQHVNILLHKLVELQSSHAFPNTDLSDAVRMMKNEFMSIQPLLFQAERKSHKLKDEMIRGWLMQLMDLVQDVEDVFDIFNLDTLSSKSHDCFYNKLLHFLSSSQRNLTVRGKINDFFSEDRKPEASFMIRGDRGIKNYVRYNLTEAVSGFVYAVAATYGTLRGLDNTQILLKFSNEITNDLKRVRRYFPKKYKPTTKMMTSLSGHAPQILFESPGIIGRQDELSMLRDKLRLRKTDETSTANLMLVIVTGKDGIGKTALVNEFYKQTKHQYAWYAWVNASEISNLFLLRNMLKGFLKSQYMKDPINMNARDEVWLKDRIQRCLNGNKFLLVLDDVSSYQWC